MATGTQARLTTSQGRRFGVTVGGAFLTLAAIAAWRGSQIPPRILGALGGVLTLAGFAVPTYLGPVERLWMRLALIVSRVTTPIVMAVMYILVLTPVGVLRRTLGGDPLSHAPAGAGYWRARPEGARRSATMKRQF